MRFSLIDLALIFASMMLGCLAVAAMSRLVGSGSLSLVHIWLYGCSVGILFFAVLAPPPYRGLGLLPLFLPACPHCKRIPDGYHILEAAWPRMRVACGRCETRIELWWRRPAARDVSPTMPSLLLSWPQSIGRWRAISSRGSVEVERGGPEV